MEYFVSPTGDDTNPGTLARPYRTIGRGLHGASPTSKLQPGDILTLRGGTYLEAVLIQGLAGTPGHEITMRSFSGERAVIDNSIAAFRPINSSAWVPAITVDPQAHPDEWASVQRFPDPALPMVGAFIDSPYRRLVSYFSERDFRADNQTFDKIFDVDPPNLARGPWKVTDEKGVPLRDPATNREFTFPWVYMGPGIWFNADVQSRRVHIRLSPTTNNVPGLEDYAGPIDPNTLALAVCDLNQSTLTVTDSKSLIFTELTFRFGGRQTILIDCCHCLSFNHVDVLASTGGIRFGALTDASFGHCQFDGGLPPWFFRADRKNEYSCLLTPGGPLFHDKLGKATIDVLMFGEGFARRDFEIHHCEFVNGHDLYLVATNMNFHHNWIDNLDDEGMMIDAQPSASGRIHSNVVTRCLSPLSMAVGGFTAGQWYIYRNLIDIRAPTAGIRPRFAGDTAVWRFGNAFKSNETTAPDGPHDVFHNTFLVYDQEGQAAYLHYRSDLSPHLRRSFNNIFVAVNPVKASDVPITFIPPPSFPGPTDGNLYHRIGAATADAFRTVPYTFKCVDFRAPSFATLDVLRASPMFEQSKTQYPPGYEASGLLTDPHFRLINADGEPQPLDDLRLRPDSPARSTGVPLPPDLQKLDDVQVMPVGPSRDIGCYPFGSQPLQVGVNGRRRFPIIGTIP